MNSITVQITVPPPGVWPNTLKPKRWRSPIVKRLRAEARVCAIEALNGRDPPRWEHAKFHTLFRFAKHHKRDKLNGLAALKAAIDGIVDAGIITNDETLEPDGVTMEYRSATPGVWLTFRPIDVEG